jgi:hypothetical protein
MPNVNASFQGQVIFRPGVYYFSNVAAAQQATGVNTPPVLFLANSFGLQPQVPATFTDPQSMTAAMRGSPSAAFVDFLFNPSNQLSGASMVTLINVSENTQATFAQQDAGSTTVLNWATVDFGLASNLMQISCEPGSIGGVDITLLDGFSGNTATGENLGLPFQIAYEGTSTTVTYSVVVTGGVAETLTITSSNANESVTLNLSAAGYPTVADIVNYLNGTGFYSAQVISNGALPSSMLDGVTGVALPKPTGTTDDFVNVTATLGDIVFWSTQFASTLAIASIANGVTSTPSVAPASNLPLTHFSGGRNIPPVLADYADGFNAGLLTPAWTVVADTNSAGVIALGTQHAVQASGITARKPRRFISGSSVGDSVTASIANAESMDAVQATYVYPGIQVVSTLTGVNTTFGGLFVAAAVAGMMAGNPVATPLTNKALVGSGPEIVLTDEQINTLQQGGVMPVTQAPGGVPKIESDLTTWQLDNNPENVFNQQVACQQSLEYAVLQGMQQFIGQIATPTTLATHKQAYIAILNSQIYNPTSGTGVLSSFDPASVVLKYTSGNQLESLSVNAIFVQQVRFITSTVNVQPLNVTL